MEIAWFTDTWLPNRDGVVTSLLLFKKILEKKGHNIYIFAPGNENEREEAVEIGSGFLSVLSSEEILKRYM